MSAQPLNFRLRFDRIQMRVASLAFGLAVAACTPEGNNPRGGEERVPAHSGDTTTNVACARGRDRGPEAGEFVRITNAEPPEPWEFSETAMALGPPPASPGYRAWPADLGIPDPDADAMDHIQDSPHFALYRFISFGVVQGYSPKCGRGGYLVASPERIDELIAQSLWRPNGLSSPYEGKPDGIQGYEFATLRFVSADRSTQCQSNSMLIDESGRVAVRAPLPVIECQISHAPDYAIGAIIPARMHPHLGEILTQIDQDSRLLIDAKLSD